MTIGKERSSHRLPTLPTICLLATCLWAVVTWLDANSRLLILDSFPADRHPVLLRSCFEAQIAAGEVHRYFIDLPAGDYLQLHIEQLGVDLLIVVRGGSRILRFDSPNGRSGTEVIDFETLVDDTYEIEIHSLDSGWYRSHISASRPPNAQDRSRTAAQLSKLLATDNISLVDEQELSLAKRADLFLESVRLWQEVQDPQEERWLLFDLLARSTAVAETVETNERDRLLARAIRLYKDAGNEWRAARLMHKKASFHQKEGNHHQALKTYAVSAEEWEAQGFVVEHAAVLNDMGLAYQSLDLFDSALESFQKARALYKSRSRPCLEGIVWINSGRIEANLSETVTALDSFQTAKDLLEQCPPQRRELSLALTKIGDMKVRLGYLAEAIDHYQSSLEISRALGDLEWTASTLNSLGLAWLESRRPEETFASLTDSRRLFQKNGRSDRAAVVLGNICWAHELLANWDRSLDCYREALQEIEGLSYQVSEAAIHTGLARVFFQRASNSPKLLEDSWIHLEQGVQLIEGIRDRSQRRDLKAALVADRQEVYYLATQIAAALHRGKPQSNALESGLSLFDRSLARNLRDSLRRVYIGAPPLSITPDISQQVRGQHLVAMATKPNGEIDQDRKLNQLVQRLRQARASQLGPNREQVPFALSVQELQRSLGNTLLLLFQEPGPEFEAQKDASHFVWIVSTDRVDLKPLPDFPTDQELEALHRLLIRSPRSRGVELRPKLLSVSKKILEPLATELEEFQTLLIVPSGALHSIPLSALLRKNDEERMVPLVTTHNLGRLPSASALPALRAVQMHRSVPTKSALLVGDAVFGPADLRLHAVLNGRPLSPPNGPPIDSPLRSRLIHSSTEVESIRLQIGNEVRTLTGFEVQTDSLADIETYGVLHFATHGLTRTDMPELTSLMLSHYDRLGRPVSDGFLRAFQIEAMRLSAHLVVLSACSSAMGRQLYGEGLIGLPQAFMASGVPRILVSLWDLEDQSSAHLMSRFYYHLAGGILSSQEALQIAQNEMLRESRWSDPFYWAAFVHYGDPQ